MAISTSTLTALLHQQRKMRKITFKYVRLVGVLHEDPEVYIPPWDGVFKALAKCGALREFIMDDIYELSCTLGGSRNWISSISGASEYKRPREMTMDLHQRGGRVLR